MKYSIISYCIAAPYFVMHFLLKPIRSLEVEEGVDLR